MDIERKSIEITEICRVEGHAAVTVNFEDGVIADVQLNVFEGARFFERIVLGHKYDEIAQRYYWWRRKRRRYFTRITLW